MIIFLSKQFAQKIVEHTVPKRKLFIVSPYLDKSSFVWERAYKQASITAFDFIKLKWLLNHQQD